MQVHVVIDGPWCWLSAQAGIWMLFQRLFFCFPTVMINVCGKQWTDFSDLFGTEVMKYEVGSTEMVTTGLAVVGMFLCVIVITVHSLGCVFVCTTVGWTRLNPAPQWAWRQSHWVMSKMKSHSVTIDRRHGSIITMQKNILGVLGSRPLTRFCSGLG